MQIIQIYRLSFECQTYFATTHNLLHQIASKAKLKISVTHER